MLRASSRISAEPGGAVVGLPGDTATGTASPVADQPPGARTRAPPKPSPEVGTDARPHVPAQLPALSDTGSSSARSREALSTPSQLRIRIGPDGDLSLAHPLLVPTARENALREQQGAGRARQGRPPPETEEATLELPSRSASRASAHRQLLYPTRATGRPVGSLASHSRFRGARALMPVGVLSAARARGHCVQHTVEGALREPRDQPARAGHDRAELDIPGDSSASAR